MSMKTILMLLIMIASTIMVEAQTLESILAGYHKAIGGKDKYPMQSAVIIKAQTQGGGGGEKRPMTFTLPIPWPMMVNKHGAFSHGPDPWIPNR
jgi:hypothetical protein